MVDLEYPFMLAWRIPSYESYNLHPVQEVCVNLSDITQELAGEIVGWCRENRDYVSLAAISPILNVLEEIAYKITFYTKGAYEEFCKRFKDDIREPYVNTHGCNEKG